MIVVMIKMAIMNDQDGHDDHDGYDDHIVAMMIITGRVKKSGTWSQVPCPPPTGEDRLSSFITNFSASLSPMMMVIYTGYPKKTHFQNTV